MEFILNEESLKGQFTMVQDFLESLKSNIRCFHIIRKSERNTISKIDDTEDKLRQQYRKNIILNRLSNVVRSNYIYTAYECLRNSLILLFGLFVFMIIVA